MTPHEPHARAPVAEERIDLAARDGFALGATLYRSERADPPAEVIVLNPGGGVASIRYRHFARFVASCGYPVLAYDYRGVGASRPRRLRGFRAGLEDWAELDHAAALDHVSTRFAGARLASISHSVGCLVAAAAPNASIVSRMIFVGPHTGYWRDYRRPWRWPMRLVWHAAMPAITRAIGYFPGRVLGLGDDFPLRFAMQWARRTDPSLRFDRAPASPPGREERLLANAASLRVPALVVTLFDDAFASDSAVERFLALVPNMPVIRHPVQPNATGGRRVGHFGFFRRRHADLWPIATRCLADRAI